MADPSPNLRVLDRDDLVRELDLVSTVFHQINRIIPEDQVVLSVPPSYLAREAISLMRRHGYSQLPVIDNDEVLGVFSFRSFSLEVAKLSLEELTKQRSAPGDLRVDDLMEQFEFARVTQEMSKVFNAMDRDNGVLIGTPDNLIGVLTPMDFLRYLYRVASPFVMVSEIELALRALIRVVMDDRQLATAAHRSLSAVYRDGNIPTRLEDMTFDNYQSIVAHGDNWNEFSGVLGSNRSLTAGKLKEIGSIRNDLFHFKREITVEDHETLASHRDWLLVKVKQAERLRSEGRQSEQA